MIYEIKNDMIPYIQKLLAYSYRESKWISFDDRHKTQRHKIDCSRDEFRKLYGRAVCKKKTEEDGIMYVTSEEADDYEMLRFLLESREEDQYLTIDYDDIVDIAPYRVEEEESLPENRKFLQVTGDPDILQWEFLKRFYQTKIFSISDGRTICIIEHCSEKAAKCIQDRACCVEKTLRSTHSATYVTREELDSWDSAYFLKKVSRPMLFCFENKNEKDDKLFHVQKEGEQI